MRRITEESKRDSLFATAAETGAGAFLKIGRWQYSIDVVRDGDQDGAGRRRRYLYAATRSELMRKIADERAKGGGSLRARRRETIGDWVTDWLEHQRRPALAPATFAVYETVWRVHLKPLLAKRRIDTFEPTDVERVYRTLREKKVGGRTVQVAGKFMRVAFDAAILQKKFRGQNAWRAIAIPRHKERDARVLTAEEAQRFVKAARDDPYEGVWLLALFGGLRLGELLGLRWCDVDLETGEVRIRQQAVEVYGRVEIGPLKTPSSVRDIVVGGTTLDAMRRRRAAASAEGHKSQFCFTTPAGRLLDRNNVRRRHFAEVCKRAEIVGLRPHDLRHTMTSHAIKLGLSPIVVARRLGHGSTRMTLDRYGHQLPGQQREAAAVLEAALDKIADPA
ncbi:MAG TPA: site-specific integrase [Candidatus Cybelea sp.]